LLDLLGDLRAEVAVRVPDASIRAALWSQVVDSDAIFESVRQGDLAGARTQIVRLMSEAERAAPAAGR
jgi:hypothetical protein